MKNFNFYLEEFNQLKNLLEEKKETNERSSVLFTLEKLITEVKQIVEGGKKGLDILKKLNQKAEKNVEENHKKFIQLLQDMEFIYAKSK